MLFEALENRSLLATITGNTAIGGFEALNSSSLLYQLSASSLALANGAPVTAWNNSGTAANNFVQADVNKQPTYQGTGLGTNDLPGVVFDGSTAGQTGNPIVAPNADELLLTTSTSPATVFIVNSTSTNNSSLDGIWGQENGDYGLRRSGANNWQSAGGFPGQLYVNGAAGSNPSAPQNSDHILSATRAPGAAIATTSIGDYFQVGTNAARSWGGQIGDLIAFNRTLGPAERTIIENSLSAKYGIGLASGDIYAGDNPGLGDYDRGVIGIGGQAVTNVALGKNATLSNQGHPQGDAAHGVDGNTNGNYGSNSVTHSDTNTNPFLLVDLGGVFTISSVDLWNRTDCCGDRMRDIRVQILDASNAVIWQNPTLINPGNVLGSPTTINVDVVALNGGLPVNGNKVRVVLEGTGEIINIAEVQVWATSQYANVAQGKTAIQSSTAAGGTPNRAVDGNTNGVYTGNSVTHTNTEANPFWQVDLAADTPISQILLYNRTDCCGDRLSDIQVEILDSSLATVFSMSGLNAGNTLDNPYMFGVDVATANGGVPVTGRHVRVTAVGASKILSLAELMVYSPPTTTGAAVSSAGSNGFGIEQTGAANLSSYLTAGHKQVANSLVNTDLPVGVDSRWDRTWYVDKTGTMSATMAFDFSDAGLASVPATTLGYQLLYSPNNNFEAANSSFSKLNITPTVVGDLVTFNVPDGSLQDGYYTLGLLDATATLQPESATANDGLADAWRIVRSGAGGVNLDFYQGATLVRSTPYASITAVNVVGSNDNDTFTVDQSGGVIARPVNYSGGGQTSTPGDSLVIFGGTATTVTHTFINNSDGSVNIDGSVITYTGLEPITDNMVVANRVFTFTGAAEAISLTDSGGADNMTRIDSSLGEFVDFVTPTATLTINTNGGDTTTITSFDAAFNTPLMTLADTSGTTSTYNLAAANIIPNVTGLVLTGNVNFNLNGFSEQIASLASTNATPVVTLSAAQTLITGDGSSTTFSGVITGPGSLTKTGAGAMTVSGGNTYTGATTVTQGTLNINQVGPGSNNANIGAGANTQLTTASIAVSAGALVNFNTGGNFSSSNTGTTLTGAGTIRLSSGVWWLGNAGGGTTISLASGGLIDVQAGTLKNDYASANWAANQASLNVNAGATFNLRNNNVNIDSLTGTGAVINDFATNTLTMGVANGTGATFSGSIGSGAAILLVKNGTGTQTLSGAGITYTGATTVNNGELILFNSTGYNSPTTVNSPARLTFGGNTNMGNGNTGATILLNNGAILQNTNPNNWTVINGAVTVPAGASATINHISNATGAAGRGFYLDGGLQGTGTVTINATNAGSGVNFRNNNTTFAGTMIVNGIASTTAFAGSGIGVGGNTSGLTNADIQLNGTMELLNQGIGWANNAPGDFFMGALSGNGVMVGNFTAGGQTRVRLGNNNNSGVFTGTIANGTGNSIVLTKNGTGTQTLAGPGIVYTGATTVAAGTLKLSNTTAFASAMTVNAGATLNLANEFTTGSTGLVFGAAATINLNGGTLSYTSTNFANTWIVLNGAVTASATSTINIAPSNSTNTGLYFDAGLLGSATTTINATTPRAGANFRNNNTTFSGQMIVNGIASATAGAGSGIGVGGNTSGLINADIQLNGTMELLNQGIGWANTASGDFFMDALTGTGVMVANFTAGGTTRVRLGNNNGSGVFSGTIVDGTGNVLSLTKNGTGTQTLSGTNTYTGTTTVNGGVLQLQNGNAIANGAGTVTVALGATLQLLSNETISAYVGNGDIGAGTNDSTLALGGNVLTTTAGASIANVTSANGGIVAGTAILDTDDDNNVTGTGIFLQAGTGVGTAVDPIETTISNLEALTATGGIFVTNTGALQIGNVTATLGGVDVTTAGDIRLIATGSINVSLFNEDVVGPGNITVDAQGATSDVNTGTAGGFGSGSIVSTGAGALVSVSAGRNVNMGTATVNDYGDIYSAGNLLVTAGQDFVIQQFTFLDVNSAGTGTVNAGRDIILFPDNTYSRISSRGGVLNLTAGRNISVGADGLSNTIDSTQAGAVPAGANINLTATTGSITLRDGINAGTAGTVTMTAGTSISDTTPAGNTRVTGLNLVATATTGITGPLETAVTRLEASGGSGGVFVANAGNLTIGGIGPMVGVSATGGDIAVTTTGSLTVSENVAATGAGTDVTLTAIDAAAAGQNLIVNAGTLVSSAAASVTLNAGDDATITGNVTSGTTTTINVDFGDAETNGVGEVAVGSGGALNITGVITTPVVGSGGGAFLNGNDDFDTFTLNPQTTTEFRINGNPPVSTIAGDILVMNVTGTTNPNLTVPGTTAPYTGPGSGSWSFTSAHRPVLFTSIEDSTITGQYHLTYDNSITPVGNLFVMRDAAQTRVQLRDGSTGGPVVYQGLLSVILSLRILGSGGNDIVTVDDINTLPDFAGTVPLVTDNANLAGTAELMFDGLGGNDTLVYNVNGTTASQSYAIGNGTGAAGLEGEVQTTAAGLTLQSYFQNVELTQRTGVGTTPGGLVIIGDSSGNSISTAANGALTRTTATGYTPFEFSGNNYSAFTVNALAGPDIVDLVSLGSGQTNNFPITLNGNTEADTVGSSRVDLQACKLEYSIVSPK